MPPDGALAAGSPEAETERPDRPLIIAFVGDQETETVLREGLLEAVPQGFEIRRGTVRAAIAALQKMPTPHTLIVDVSGEDQPLSALERPVRAWSSRTCACWSSAIATTSTSIAR